MVLLMVLITVVISLLNLYYNQKNIKVFLAWSSKINFRLILMIMYVNWLSGLLYLVLYLLVVIIFLYRLEYQSQYWDQYRIRSLGEMLGLVLGLCTFSGLPPFLGFFYKYIFLSRINNIGRGTMSLYVFFFFLNQLYFRS